MLRAARVTSSSALELMNTGISLLSASLFSGECSVAGGALAQPALYGTDAASECGVVLTLGQLRAFCQKRSGSPVPDDAAPLPQFYAQLPANARLAVWGDSDPDVAEEWVQIVGEQPGVCLCRAGVHQIGCRRRVSRLRSVTAALRVVV